MPIRFSISARTILTAAALAASCVLSGCKAHDMGVAYSDKEAASIDNSWLIVAGTCWPDMMHSGYSLAGVKSYLVDPLHFRATFAAYSGFSDTELRDIITKPVQSAPQGDTDVLNHTSDRVLTRQQALDGKASEAMLPANNNNLAPADSLCTVQKGLPVGFK